MIMFANFRYVFITSILKGRSRSESTCYEKVIHLSQRFSSMLCLFYFLHSFISFKYDFHIGAERTISKNARNVNKYLCRW